VREDFASEADSDAFRALSEEERELDGESDGFLVSAVIGELPFGDFGAVDDIAGELGEASLNVTRSGGGVAGEDAAPVALGVNDVAFLAESDESIADGSVTVGVIFHGVADDVSDFVIATVIEFIHGVEDAPLDGFEAVIDVRDGAFQDNVRGVIHEIVGVHAFHRLAGGVDERGGSGIGHCSVIL
jgi:hypothetical protein